MPEVEIRKFASVVEEVFHEGGPRATTPLRRAAVIAVIKTPSRVPTSRISSPSWKTSNPLA